MKGVFITKGFGRDTYRIDFSNDIEESARLLRDSFNGRCSIEVARKYETKFPRALKTYMGKLLDNYSLDPRGYMFKFRNVKNSVFDEIDEVYDDFYYVTMEAYKRIVKCNNGIIDEDEVDIFFKDSVDLIKHGDIKSLSGKYLDNGAYVKDYTSNIIREISVFKNSFDSHTYLGCSDVTDIDSSKKSLRELKRNCKKYKVNYNDLDIDDVYTCYFYLDKGGVVTREYIPNDLKVLLNMCYMSNILNVYELNRHETKFYFYAKDVYNLLSEEYNCKDRKLSDSYIESLEYVIGRHLTIDDVYEQFEIHISDRYKNINKLMRHTYNVSQEKYGTYKAILSILKLYDIYAKSNKDISNIDSTLKHKCEKDLSISYDAYGIVKDVKVDSTKNKKTQNVKNDMQAIYELVQKINSGISMECIGKLSKWCDENGKNLNDTLNYIVYDFLIKQ